MFTNCECIGIEVRHTKDYTTQKPKDVYYFHGRVTDKEALEGCITFSAKIPDHLVAEFRVGGIYFIAYQSYNGYNRIVEVFQK